MHNIHKLLLILSIFVFFITYALTGETCIMGTCWGNSEMAIWYGLGAASLWIVLVELMKILVFKITHRQISWRKTINIVIVPLFIIVYVLGKVSAQNIDINSF